MSGLWYSSWAYMHGRHSDVCHSSRILFHIMKSRCGVPTGVRQRFVMQIHSLLSSHGKDEAAWQQHPLMEEAGTRTVRGLLSRHLAVFNAHSITLAQFSAYKSGKVARR
ncbi:hypothetical protein LSAT2_012158 [Lamellibrachia satsuma]|nr:hypothetical protein LSAT2_012158 [Lamellibrachia satsuma]